MEGQMRRDTIIKMLGEKGKPLSGTELACLLDRQPAEVLRRREYQSANPTGESWETDCSGLSEGHEKS